MEIFCKHNRVNTYQNRNPFKGALSVLRQFQVTESPLKMTKNTFYFTLKSCTKYGGETRPFFEKLKLGIPLDQQSQVSYSFFLFYV